MIALTGIAFPFWRVGVKYPVLPQLFSIPVPCRNHAASIISSAENSFVACPRKNICKSTKNNLQIRNINQITAKVLACLNVF
jgi:hypothetical protein